MVRELGEEIGVRGEHVEIVMQKGGYRYRFPKPMRRFGRNIGQEQTYFLCRFLGKDEDINLKTEHPEFRSFRWIAPHEFRLDLAAVFQAGRVPAGDAGLFRGGSAGWEDRAM